MTKSLITSIWIVVFVYFLFPFSSVFSQVPQLTITEVFPDPKVVGDSDGEWFEIYNPTDQPFQLKGMVLKDEGRDSHAIETDLTINPKSYLVFCKNKNIEQNGGVNCAYQYSKFSLANESDEIILEKDGEITRLVYTKSSHPLKSGRSMELDGSNWHESTSQFGKGDYGTPGSGNSSAPTAIPPSQPTATLKPTDIPKPTKPTAPTQSTEKVLAAIQANSAEEVEDEELTREGYDSPVIYRITPEEASPTAHVATTSATTYSPLISRFLFSAGIFSFIVMAISIFLIHQKELAKN